MKKCKICGSDKVAKQLKVREMMFGTKHEFHYWQCGNCGCLQIDEIPDNMSTYYPSNYYSFDYKTNSIFNYIKIFFKYFRNKYIVFRKNLFGKFLFNHIIGDIRVRSLIHLDITKQTSILDVGCGSGDILKSLLAIGCTNLLGIDPFVEKDTEYENNLKILKRSFTQLTQKFDLIMFHHSFEHMANPDEVFRHLATILNPNGICMIRIPVADSWAFENYGKDWVQLDAPRHFFLHTTKSIDFLCKQNNLSLKQVIFDSNELQFFGSQQYISDIPLFCDNSYIVNKSKSIFSKKDIENFSKRASQLNQSGQGDQAIFLIQHANK